MTQDEMAGWHLQLNGHGFARTPVDSEGLYPSSECCTPWGHKESDVTQQLNIFIKNLQPQQPSLTTLENVESSEGVGYSLLLKFPHC